MTFEGSVGEFRQFLGVAETRNPDVSRWSVGMHIEHCCLAVIGIEKVLKNSKVPAPFAFPPILRLVVFLTGKMPRGRAQSPQAVIPKEQRSAEQLGAIIDRAERAVEEARRLPAQSWFHHFVFGVLKRDRALKFFIIHNNHHLKIIRDIVAKNFYSDSVAAS